MNSPSPPRSRQAFCSGSWPTSSLTMSSKARQGQVDKDRLTRSGRQGQVGLSLGEDIGEPSLHTTVTSRYQGRNKSENTRRRIQETVDVMERC